MGYWSWGKTVSFTVLYLFILFFTWKSLIGEVEMKWKILSTIMAPIVIGVSLYMKEQK